jgi:hypothetical protein
MSTRLSEALKQIVSIASNTPNMTDAVAQIVSAAKGALKAPSGTAKVKSQGYAWKVARKTGLFTDDLVQLMAEKGNGGCFVALAIPGCDTDTSRLVEAVFEPNEPSDGPGGILYLHLTPKMERLLVDAVERDDDVRKVRPNRRENRRANTPTTEPTIRAEVHSDDHRFWTDFDARLWFEQATDEEITDLVEIDFHGNTEADEVAEYMIDFDGDVERVFDLKERQGFEVTVCREDASKWIKANRTDLWAKLTNSGDDGAEELAEAAGRYYDSDKSYYKSLHG